MPEKVIVDKTFLIRQGSIFSDLPAYEIEFISKKAEFFEYTKDEFIYREGGPADAFYLVISGRVRAFTTAACGELTNLEYLHRGFYFGIISLLTNEPHSVSAQVVNDFLILRVASADFYFILKALPQLAIHFSSILARCLKRERGPKAKRRQEKSCQIFLNLTY